MPTINMKMHLWALGLALSLILFTGCSGPVQIANNTSGPIDVIYGGKVLHSNVAPGSVVEITAFDGNAVIARGYDTSSNLVGLATFSVSTTPHRYEVLLISNKDFNRGEK